MGFAVFKSVGGHSMSPVGSTPIRSRQHQLRCQLNALYLFIFVTSSLAKSDLCDQLFEVNCMPDQLLERPGCDCHRTAAPPAPRAAPARCRPPTRCPTRLRFAFASCQHFEPGYYTAYEHMAEGGSRTWSCTWATTSTKAAAPRQAACASTSARSSRRSTDYRNRHAQYKTDPALQAMHAAVPVDRHLGRPRSATTTTRATIPEEPDRRPSEIPRCGAPPPTRPTTSTCRCGARRLPHGPDMPLYRRVSFGRLADVLRARHAAVPHRSALRRRRASRPARGARSESARSWATAQRQWLFDGLAAVAGHVERAGAAGDDGPGRLRARREESLQHGPVARLRGRPPPRAQVPARAQDRQPGRAHRRHPHATGPTT